MLHGGSHELDPKKLILIWDTGASFGLTPFQSNCIDHVQCDILVIDVICQGENDPIVDAIYNDLFDTNRDWYAEDEFDYGNH